MHAGACCGRACLLLTPCMGVPWRHVNAAALKCGFYCNPYLFCCFSSTFNYLSEILDSDQKALSDERPEDVVMRPETFIIGGGGMVLLFGSSGRGPHNAGESQGHRMKPVVAVHAGTLPRRCSHVLQLLASRCSTCDLHRYMPASCICTHQQPGTHGMHVQMLCECAAGNALC